MKANMNRKLNVQKVHSIKENVNVNGRIFQVLKKVTEMVNYYKYSFSWYFSLTEKCFFKNWKFNSKDTKNWVFERQRKHNKLNFTIGVFWVLEKTNTAKSLKINYWHWSNQELCYRSLVWTWTEKKRFPEERWHINKWTNEELSFKGMLKF